MPSVPGCRPIPLPELLAAEGWQVQAFRALSLLGVPAAAALAIPAP
jgi:hypothetical protein